MSVPWTGFPLAKLVALAKPPRARSTSRCRPSSTAHGAGAEVVPVSLALYRGADPGGGGQRSGLHRHGIYGKPLANQFRRADPPRGAVEVRLQVGQIDHEDLFRGERPKTSGKACRRRNTASGQREPGRVHPRWSQATERVLGTDQRVPTLIYNGYGEQVAGLYKGSRRSGLSSDRGRAGRRHAQ